MVYIYHIIMYYDVYIHKLSVYGALHCVSRHIIIVINIWQFII